MRFRKSIKICKGVRLNLSTSGISMSAGMRGLSVTSGKKGTYLNTSIPGTGFYSRQKIDSKHTTTTKSSQRSTPTSNKSIGTSAQVESFNKSIAEFVSIISHAENVYSAEDIRTALESLTPREYVKNTYSISIPDRSNILSNLESEARQNVSKLAFWSLKKRRQQYIDENIDIRYEEAYNEWQRNKKKFEENEEINAATANEEYRIEYNREHLHLSNILAGSDTYVESEINSWLSEIELPIDFSIQYDYDQSTGTFCVDLDLPEVEDLPDEFATQLASGKMKMKKKTQTELRHDYARCVFGLAIYLASHIFNTSTAIKNILISGYTQRRDKVGNLNDDYIFSIIFTRTAFEHEDLSSKDPIEFCMLFENRCIMSKTHVFKVIVPFDAHHI